jgi:hypothetical protein
MKKGAEVFKIFTILHQNNVYNDKAIEVGLFIGFVPNLGKFLYINKKRISWVDRFSIGIIADYFRSAFSAFDWI